VTVMRGTFRIFVSSTFSDLKVERDALQKYVFPTLRDLCMRHGCRFQAIDLRWGVSEEAALDQQTMKICLEEIARCQKTTPRPNFIVLLGDRYGWRPLPYDIPTSEFEKIISLTTGPRDHELLTRWYRRDDNAVPAVYCLQPRELDLSDAETNEQRRAKRKQEFERWSEIESELRRLLLTDVTRLSVNREQLLTYDTSATEQEIEAGAMKFEDTPDHVFCFFRTIPNLPADESAKDFLDLKNSGGQFERVAQARDRQNALKQRLRDLLPESTFEYEAEWVGPTERDSWVFTRCKNVIDALTERVSNLAKVKQAAFVDRDWERLKETAARAFSKVDDGPPIDAPRIKSKVSLDHVPKLCADVFLSLARVILEEIEQLKRVDALDREISEHNSFGRDRARLFTGRESILEHIRDYITHADPRVLLVYGESGSGKSALMAKAAADAAELSPNAVVITRFLGVTPDSSGARALLASLTSEISREYGAVGTALSNDLAGLREAFTDRLRLATTARPLILFLDALDQLPDWWVALELALFRGNLPPLVRVVATALTDEASELRSKNASSINAIELGRLTGDESSELFDRWLTESRRRLQPRQLAAAVASSEQVRLPLYLKLAFEEARRWRSYDDTTELGPSVADLIRSLFGRLAAYSNHGSVLVSHSLGLLTASQRGLSEDEVLDLLSADSTVMADFRNRSPESPEVSALPVVVWLRLHAELEPYLARRDAGGTTVITFNHRQFAEAIEREIDCDVEWQCVRRRALAQYFRQIADPGGDATWRGAASRGFSELPFHLHQAALLSRDNRDLCALAEDLKFRNRQFEVLIDIDPVAQTHAYAINAAAESQDTALIVRYALARSELNYILARSFLYRLSLVAREKPYLALSVASLLPLARDRLLARVQIAWSISRAAATQPLVRKILTELSADHEALASSRDVGLLLTIARELAERGFEEASCIARLIPDCPLRKLTLHSWQQGPERVRALARALELPAPGSLSDEEIEAASRIETFAVISYNSGLVQSRPDKFEIAAARRFGFTGPDAAFAAVAARSILGSDFEAAELLVNRVLFNSQGMSPTPVHSMLAVSVALQQAGEVVLASEFRDRVTTRAKVLAGFAGDERSRRESLTLLSAVTGAVPHHSPSWVPLNDRLLVDALDAKIPESS